MHRRTFVTLTLLGGAVVAAGQAFAAPLLEGEAVRSADKAKVRFSWTGGAGSVTIFQSNDPDTPRGSVRPVQTDVLGGAAEVVAPISPRPYFLVTTRGGGQVRLAERLLPLEGGRNFRDLGGYRAEDGRQVRWGRIFRSGVMSGLTVGDIDYLRGLGVSVICDLRSPQERTAEPSPLLAAGGPKVVAFDYDMSASLGGIAGMKTRQDAVMGFAAAYVGFLDMLTPHYTDMFARLARGEAPLAMNCSAGKDRTGMASALVLSVLGVPRETVVADYALTQVYTPPATYMKVMSSGAHVSGLTPEQAQAMSRLPREVLEVMMGSDPVVMRRALATIDQKYGGPVALAKARFGLSEAGLARMRSLYLI